MQLQLFPFPGHSTTHNVLKTWGNDPESLGHRKWQNALRYKLKVKDWHSLATNCTLISDRFTTVLQPESAVNLPAYVGIFDAFTR